MRCESDRERRIEAGAHRHPKRIGREPDPGDNDWVRAGGECQGRLPAGVGVSAQRTRLDNRVGHRRHRITRRDRRRHPNSDPTGRRLSRQRAWHHREWYQRDRDHDASDVPRRLVRSGGPRLGRWQASLPARDLGA